MTLKERLTSVVIRFVIEQPAKRQGLIKLTQSLTDSGEALHRDLERIEDNDKNRTQLRHIIAIERWGQRRLKVALGEPFIHDENHAYKPGGDTPWIALKEMYSATRAETIALADVLRSKDLTQKVLHNQFGFVSVLGWLRYLETHARLEGKRLR